MSDKKSSLINKLKNKKLIIASISVMVAAALAAAGYFVLSKKSAREFYLESEAKNFRKYSDHLKKLYRDFYASQEPYMDSRYRKRAELTADIKAEGDSPFGIAKAQNIIDIIEKCKVIINTKNNPKGKESLTNLSLLIEKSPIIDAIAFTRDGKLGFTVPVLTPDRYFMLDINRVDEVYNRFNIPFRPKRFVKKADIAQTIKFNDTELDEIAKEYGSLISGLIEEKDVKYGKNVVLKVGGKEVKGREVVVTLGSDKTKKLIRQALDKASEDNRMLRLTYENYADILGLVGDTGLLQLVDVLNETGYLQLNENIMAILESMDIKKNLEGFKSDIKEFGSKSGYPEGLKMALVLDKSGNILDRKVSVSFIRSSGGQKSSIDIHTGSNDIKNDNFKNGFFTLRLTKTGPGGEKLLDALTINSKLTATPKNEDEKGRVELIYEKNKGGNVEFAVAAGVDIDRSTDRLTLKRNNIMKYNIEVHGDSPDITDRFYGEISMVSGENKKQKTRNTSTGIVVNADLPSFGMKPLVLKFNLVQEDRFDIQEFSLPEVQAARSVDLNTIPDADLKKVEEEIMASFGTFYMSNKSLIDSVTGNR